MATRRVPQLFLAERKKLDDDDDVMLENVLTV
jgi:hypothetical protein